MRGLRKETRYKPAQLTEFTSSLQAPPAPHLVDEGPMSL